MKTKEKKNNYCSLKNKWFTETKPAKIAPTGDINCDWISETTDNMTSDTRDVTR